MHEIPTKWKTMTLSYLNFLTNVLNRQNIHGLNFEVKIIQTCVYFIRNVWKTDVSRENDASVIEFSKTKICEILTVDCTEEKITSAQYKILQWCLTIGESVSLPSPWGMNKSRGGWRSGTSTLDVECCPSSSCRSNLKLVEAVAVFQVEYTLVRLLCSPFKGN